jgi:hypothetical protein
MGSRDRASVEAFQERTGIKPAIGEHLDALSRLQNLALSLIKCCELEKCGICDGDGVWHGGDPIDGIISDMHVLWRGYWTKSWENRFAETKEATS